DQVRGEGDDGSGGHWLVLLRVRVAQAPRVWCAEVFDGHGRCLGPYGAHPFTVSGYVIPGVSGLPGAVPVPPAVVGDALVARQAGLCTQRGVGVTDPVRRLDLVIGAGVGGEADRGPVGAVRALVPVEVEDGYAADRDARRVTGLGPAAAGDRVVLALDRDCVAVSHVLESEGCGVGLGRLVNRLELAQRGDSLGGEEPIVGVERADLDSVPVLNVLRAQTRSGVVVARDLHQRVDLLLLRGGVVDLGQVPRPCDEPSACVTGAVHAVVVHAVNGASVQDAVFVSLLHAVAWLEFELAHQCASFLSSPASAAASAGAGSVILFGRGVGGEGRLDQAVVGSPGSIGLASEGPSSACYVYRLVRVDNCGSGQCEPVLYLDRDRVAVAHVLETEGLRLVVDLGQVPRPCDEPSACVTGAVHAVVVHAVNGAVEQAVAEGVVADDAVALLELGHSVILFSLMSAAWLSTAAIMR